MRIVIDYRPALRGRTGVGEYVHQLARAWRMEYPDDELVLFTSSWKDRPAAALARDIPGARISDHRIPVQLLNAMWHNVEWPAVETFIGEACDVAFSPHPLLLPTRAAQVVMVHDLNFLTHPERTTREIKRDYPRLARSHAHRAGAVVVPSEFTAGEVHDRLQVSREHIVVCPPGLPDWRGTQRHFDRDGYLLFMGTLEPRKNVPGLLDAYSQLVTRRLAPSGVEGPSVPPLMLAGGADAAARDLLQRVNEPPLAGRVTHLGYIADADRERVYAGARALVLPSFEEGFGMPALEAMSLGIPVVVSDRGALPGLVGDAGLVIDAADVSALADALDRVTSDDVLAEALSGRGRARAATFSWRHTATAVRRACEMAIGRRAARQ